MGDVCCKSKKASEERSYWWLWVLVVLIILTIIGIVFRERLRVLLFSLRGKFKKGPSTTGFKPPFPPPTAMTRGPTPLMRRPLPKPVTKQDKDMEETFKRLREMGK